MLPEELLQQVRQLQVFTRRAVNEVFAGEYTSAFKGRGMEFAEVREYAPGDDVRTIDWNVTARTGLPHVKRFVEERELTVMLAVDMSASGAFGSLRHTKSRTAARLCAVLAFVAVQSHDRVGLLLFTDRVELFIPPKKGRNHVLRVIRELLSFEAREGAGTDIGAALEQLRGVLKKRSVILLVSDFLIPGCGPGELPEGVSTALSVAARKHDLIVATVTDPRENELPAVGLVELRDAETGRMMVLDTQSRRLRQRYAVAARRRSEELARTLRRMGIDRLDISTGKPFVHDLMELFRRRERRRSR